MFFSLSKSTNLLFPYHHPLGNLILNTDAGWHRLEQDGHVFVYKGYIDDSYIKDSLSYIKDQEHTGNFCIFDYDIVSKNIEIKTNLYRGFTIWHDQKSLSNLFPEGYTIWADSTISVDQDLQMSERKIDIIGKVETETLQVDQLIDTVHNILTRRTRAFLQHNQLPLKVFCSGGIDSMLVFSYIKASTDRYQMIFQQHVEWDEFWCRNQCRLKQNFWGYSQIHHWTDPCVLSSGAPGDEFMLRSPVTANLWLKYHGTNILDELQKNPNTLHRDYFLQHKHINLFEQQEKDDELNSMCFEKFATYLCNIVANDCQHWHLGNTLTFTPLRDIEIFKLFLRLSKSDGIKQILDSDISKKLISKNDPNLLNYISDSKNSEETLSNMVGLMSKYLANSGQ